jgi:hypothetical protein
VNLLAQFGFDNVPAVLSTDECKELIDGLGPVFGAGRRGLLSFPCVSELARSNRLLDLVRPHLSVHPEPVRAIYFDKSTDANWLVTWHQDLTIAVDKKLDLPGFGPWSIKNGIPHVQPPIEYLEQMLALRLHLDDTDEFNGALRVLCGTHKFGRLTAKQIQGLGTQHEEKLCIASAGDALLMRPLLLHASGRSTSNQKRRVLHIEYAGFTLPSGLQWHNAA